MSATSSTTKELKKKLKKAQAQLADEREEKKIIIEEAAEAIEIAEDAIAEAAESLEKKTSEISSNKKGGKKGGKNDVKKDVKTAVKKIEPIHDISNVKFTSVSGMRKAIKGLHMAYFLAKYNDAIRVSKPTCSVLVNYYNNNSSLTKAKLQWIIINALKLTRELNPDANTLLPRFINSSIAQSENVDM